MRKYLLHFLLVLSTFLSLGLEVQAMLAELKPPQTELVEGDLFPEVFSDSYQAETACTSGTPAYTFPFLQLDFSQVLQVYHTNLQIRFKQQNLEADLISRSCDHFRWTVYSREEDAAEPLSTLFG